MSYGQYHSYLLPRGTWYFCHPSVGTRDSGTRPGEEMTEVSEAEVPRLLSRGPCPEGASSSTVCSSGSNSNSRVTTTIIYEIKDLLVTTRVPFLSTLSLLHYIHFNESYRDRVDVYV